MKGETIFNVNVPANKKISKLEIIDKTLRDADLSNNKLLLN